ncbi:MAG: helix-turn-helix transcriptional regulator, partial [Pseudonocardia sp.]|nr:helix-turn-helix transcriptional regulator [Pseudonocardia sp.]
RPRAHPAARRERFAVLVHSMQAGAAPVDIADAAAPLLASPFLEETFESHVAALTALLQAEWHSRAVEHTETLLEHVRTRNAPTWLAILLAIRGELHLRSGELEQARSTCLSAVSAIGINGWGVGIGVPLSSAVLACVAMGRHAEAASLLQSPLPQEIFETRYGLAVLRACGIVALALGSAPEAHESFLQCRSLALSWNIDAPTYAPWRTDLAQASLMLGDGDAAHRLARAHHERHATAGPRVRGLAARVLASTVKGAQRLAVLGESVDLLRTAGDGYALAGALLDLARAHAALGHETDALAAAREAAVLAGACGAEPLAGDPLIARAAATRAEQPSPPSDCFLTDAEQRVAVLAAGGHLNKDIGKELFITVSTVEQHLTRIYRKLGISKRADLGPCLNHYTFAPRS